MPNFRTAGAWGPGLGRKLTAPEADSNIWELAQAITALQSDRPEPNSIASITVAGAAMTIHMTDGTTIGPLPLPVLSFKWRGAWSPFTLYGTLDTFVQDGVGIFSVLADHTSGATFDPALEISGEAAYQKIWGFAPDGGSSIVYDLEFQYQGGLADATTAPVNFLALRPFMVPQLGHLAWLVTPASAEDQVLPILHGTTPIGTVTFVVGANLGTVLITADESFALGERLVIGLPATPDPTAAGMTVALAARRVI